MDKSALKKVEASEIKNVTSDEVQTYVTLFTNILKKLVENPDDVSINLFYAKNSEKQECICCDVFVNKKDLGLIIGKNGKIVKSMTTIGHSIMAKHKVLFGWYIMNVDENK